ncbi:MAG: hypothetical protein WBP81_20320 [Solirubrobacteraceae bacterium]
MATRWGKRVSATAFNDIHGWDGAGALTRYIDSFNTTDGQARRQLIGELYAEDAHYTDP